MSKNLATACTRHFVSDELSIHFTQHENGGIDGKVTILHNDVKFERPIVGIFCESEEKKEITFFADWTDPNVEHVVRSAYVGEIVMNNSTEFLVLRLLTNYHSPINSMFDLSLDGFIILSCQSCSSIENSFVNLTE